MATITAGRFVCTNDDGDGCLVGNSTQIVFALGSVPSVSSWLNSAGATDVMVTVVPDNENVCLSALSHTVGSGTPVSVPNFSPAPFTCNVIPPHGISETAAITLDPTKQITAASIAQNTGVPSRAARALQRLWLQSRIPQLRKRIR